MKTCSKCNIEKELLEFYKQTRRVDGLHPWCKLCCKSYELVNIEAKRQRLRRWRLRNPERVKELSNVYKITRKDKIRIEQNNWQKKARKEREIFILAQNMRARIRLALKNNQKQGSTLEALDCSFEQLKKHLESKFQPEMSWDNYGKNGWHIDHIKPLSIFNLKDNEQYKEAFRYTNLQPLWAEDNLKKGNRYGG